MPANHQLQKSNLNKDILNGQVNCTEIPLEIAELSSKIVKDVIFVFDNGAWWVKGDSQVACNSKNIDL